MNRAILWIVVAIMLLQLFQLVEIRHRLIEISAKAGVATAELKTEAVLHRLAK